MKRFGALLSVLIGLYCVLNFETQGQNILVKNYLIDTQNSSGSFFLPDSTIIFNNATEQETSQIQNLRIPPSIQSFITPYSSKKRVELLINKEITDYLNLSEFHVIRFEGSDIIHPFACFW